MEHHVAFTAGAASGVPDRDVIIRDDPDRATVQVIGLSAAEVNAALQLLAKSRMMAGHANRTATANLLEALAAERVSLTTTSNMVAAQGLALLRARLLESAHFTYETLGEVRAASADTVRGAIKRARDRGEVFTVAHSGRTILPAFQFDRSGQVKQESAEVVRVLRAGGLDGWQLWEWMASPTGWLDGDVPADVLNREPDLVLSVATDYAEELSLGRQGAAFKPAPPSESAR